MARLQQHAEHPAKPPIPTSNTRPIDRSNLLEVMQRRAILRQRAPIGLANLKSHTVTFDWSQVRWHSKPNSQSAPQKDDPEQPNVKVLASFTTGNNAFYALQFMKYDGSEERLWHNSASE